MWMSVLKRLWSLTRTCYTVVAEAVTRTCSQLLRINREANKMNFAQKIKKVADFTKGEDCRIEIIHRRGCPAISRGDLTDCTCDFSILLSEKATRKNRRLH